MKKLIILSILLISFCSFSQKKITGNFLVTAKNDSISTLQNRLNCDVFKVNHTKGLQIGSEYLCKLKVNKKEGVFTYASMILFAYSENEMRIRRKKILYKK